jgi:hypothetical protein
MSPHLADHCILMIYAPFDFANFSAMVDRRYKQFVGAIAPLGHA